METVPLSMVNLWNLLGLSMRGGDSIDSFDTGKKGVSVRKGDGVEEGC